MKKKLTLSICSFLIFALPALAMPASGGGTEPGTEGPKTEEKAMTKEEFKAKIDGMKERIKALRTEKRAADTREEKRAVREKIKDIKKEAKALKQQELSGGIYIGGGALIVIILLIILL